MHLLARLAALLTLTLVLAGTAGAPASAAVPDAFVTATALHGPTGTKLAGAWCNPQGLTLYDTRELVGGGTRSIVVDPFNDPVGPSRSGSSLFRPTRPLSPPAANRSGWRRRRLGRPPPSPSPHPGSGAQGRGQRTDLRGPGMCQDHPDLAHGHPGVGGPVQRGRGQAHPGPAGQRRLPAAGRPGRPGDRRRRLHGHPGLGSRSPPAPLTAAGGWGAPPGRRGRPGGGRWRRGCGAGGG